MGVVLNKILFQPPDPPHALDARKFRVKWVKCPKEAGKQIQIPIVYLRHKSSKICVLHSHGNATDLGQMIPYLQLFRQAFKVNVCGYEYQGYGHSKPKVQPNENRVFASVETTMKFLIKEKGIPVENIVLFGTSLGSAPSFHIASKYNIRGLVVQSGFISVVRTKFEFMKDLVQELDLFENFKLIEKVKCPIFVIHGCKDELVPYSHGRHVYKHSKYKFEPLFVEFAGHNNIIDSTGIDNYLKRIFEFLIYLQKFHTKIKPLLLKKEEEEKKKKEELAKKELEDDKKPQKEQKKKAEDGEKEVEIKIEEKPKETKKVPENKGEKKVEGKIPKKVDKTDVKEKTEKTEV